jgi:HD-GYP domain-containing protein (c-di-GMP phosphodiesterase class II)
MNSIDYSLCEQEPIHIPGLIQPHGYALSFDVQTLLITGVSVNLTSPLLGTSLSQWLEPLHLEGIIQWLQENDLGKSVWYSIELPLLELSAVDTLLTRNGDEALLEFLPSIESAQHVCAHARLGEASSRIASAESIETMCRYMSEEILKLAGYDRVMVYRFDREYNGCVIAETRKPDPKIISYLDLNFPASDIPAQARELYRKNLIRIIVDADYLPVGFLRSPNLPILDMTYSHLRSISPVHIEYLHNMGVKATMTISILIEGKLWGLIACHHTKPLLQSLRVIQLCETFGEIFSALLSTRLESDLQKQQTRLLTRLESMSEQFQNETHSVATFSEAVRDYSPLFLSLMNADGFFLFSPHYFNAHGKECNREEIAILVASLESHMTNNMIITDSLAQIFPHFPQSLLEKCAGVVILKTAVPEPLYWVWVRHEQSFTLTWSGNPNEKGYINDHGGISPRTSFAAYKEIVRYQSLHWDQSEREFFPLLLSTLEHLGGTFATKSINWQQAKQIALLEEEKSLHYSQLLESLIELIEQRDAYTAGHTRRVAHYCDIIGRVMNLDPLTHSTLYEAAVLHDIGKVVVPDAILLKPGKLTANEYALIQQHVTTGVSLLDKISYYHPLAQIIRHHHEKYDGSGYPQGLKADEIPIASHIMIVADAIDAMTSNRIYQPRRSMREAIEEIIRYRGSWYHPDVADAAAASLHLLEGDLLSSQIPLTPVEHARFAYFFKDPLTEAYNESYLKMVIEDQIPERRFSYYVLVELKGMSAFNASRGWHTGDALIRSIALILFKMAPTDNIFRVFGDDFVIGFVSESECEFFVSRIPSEVETITLNHRKLSPDEMQTLLSQT